MSSGGIASKNLVGDHGIVIRGRGNAAHDTALASAAVSRLNSWGDGTLWIEGPLWLNAALDFVGDISVRGIGPDAEIVSVDQSFPLTWNDSWYYTSVTRYPFTMSHSFSESFTPTGVTPARGDWVYLYSSDALTGVPPHNGYGTYAYPMELHKVYHNISGKCYVDSPIIDYMTVDPRMAVVPMSRDIVVDNLRFSVAAGFTPADYSVFLKFKTCSGLRVMNCTFERACTGAVDLYMCGDSEVTGNTIAGITNADGAYGITVRTSYNTRIIDNWITGCRHAITTSCDISNASARWGTPLKLLIKRNVVEVPPKGTDAGLSSETASGIHTHAEGWEVTIHDNEVDVLGGDGSLAGYGIAVSSRNAVVTENRVRGYNYGPPWYGGHGVYTYAQNTKIERNTFERLWYGVVTAQTGDYATYCDGAEIDGNRFRDITYPPIKLAVGSNHRVGPNNRYERCGGRSGTTPQASKCHIQIGELRQATVTFTAGTTTVNQTAHPWTANCPIFFTNTGGGLPTYGGGTPLVAGTTYYVKTVTTNAFTIAATRGGTALTFDVPGVGTHTSHGPNIPGTGIRISGDVSYKGDNDYFVETNSADETDVNVEGCTTVGYSGAAFSNRYANRAALQAAYSGLNFGM